MAKRRRVVPTSRLKKPTKKPAKKPLARRRVTPKPTPITRQPDPQPMKDLPPTPGGRLYNPAARYTPKGYSGPGFGLGPGGVYNPTLQAQLHMAKTDLDEVSAFAAANPNDERARMKAMDYAAKVKNLQGDIDSISGGRYGFKPSTPPGITAPRMGNPNFRMRTSPTRNKPVPGTGAIYNQQDFMAAYNAYKNRFSPNNSAATPNTFINAFTRPQPRRRIIPRRRA